MNKMLLISKLRAARPDEDTRNFHAFDFIHAFGSAREALLYAKLFWPDFTEFKDMVFLSQTVEHEDDRQRIERALERYGNDLTRTEESFNIVEIPELFGRRIGEADDEEDGLLTEIIIEAWPCRLKFLFPHYKFIVKIVKNEDTNDDVAIAFHRDRNGANP